jgi:hypothetical protein
MLECFGRSLSTDVLLLWIEGCGNAVNEMCEIVDPCLVLGVLKYVDPFQSMCIVHLHSRSICDALIPRPTHVAYVRGFYTKDIPFCIHTQPFVFNFSKETVIITGDARARSAATRGRVAIGWVVTGKSRIV